jgi:hypothetical protein
VTLIPSTTSASARVPPPPAPVIVDLGDDEHDGVAATAQRIDSFVAAPSSPSPILDAAVTPVAAAGPRIATVALDENQLPDEQDPDKREVVSPGPRDDPRDTPQPQQSRTRDALAVLMDKKRQLLANQSRKVETPATAEGPSALTLKLQYEGVMSFLVMLLGM